MFYSTPKWWRPLLWAGLLALALLLAWQAATSGALLAADAIALSEPWRFVDESKPGAPAARGDLAVVGEESPTQVAARFNLSSTMQALALQLHNNDLGGLPLAQVDELGYCTYLTDGPRPYAVTLQINIDADVTDGDDGWQGRLVYTPSYNGAVIQGEWQCWNTLVGKWWATGGPVAEKATADNPQPLGTLLAHFPNLGVNERYSVVTLKAGDGWDYFEGEASPVVIGVEGERFDVAFGNAPPDASQGNEVLLPVLLNESQPSPQNDDKKPEQQEDKNKDGKNKDGKQDKWDNVDWGDLDWANFDWDTIDWEKIDWENLGWGAFGWRGDERAEAIDAFVQDVKQCKENGWAGMGFNTPGDCVAYYVEAHTPDDLNWSDLNLSDLNWDDVEWRRDWYDRDNGDDNGEGRNRRTDRERRGNDD